MFTLSNNYNTILTNSCEKSPTEILRDVQEHSKDVYKTEVLGGSCSGNVALPGDCNDRDELHKLYAEEMKARDNQDELYNLIVRPEIDSKTRLDVYNTMIKNAASATGSTFYNKMLKNIYSGGSISTQCKFINCPSDLHKDQGHYNTEDSYTYIYGECNEKLINNGLNVELFKQINGTEVTYGMVKNAEGFVWNNGLIVYNKNTIVVRNLDNRYGQPGFCQSAKFFNQLGVDIMHKYIVPQLISNVNANIVNSKSRPEEIKNEICNMYNKIYTEKLEMLETQRETITEDILFEDAPAQETLNKVLDPKDAKIDHLEKKVNALSSKLDLLLSKMSIMEELLMDVSIEKHTNSAEGCVVPN
jgi:hypothetical protein